MDFVILLGWREGTTEAERDTALARRGGWEYPDGLTVTGEHWTPSEDVTVVITAEADEYRPIWEMVANWSDLFDIQVLPAVTATEGLDIGPGVLGSRMR